jgi:hypothetical protein
MRRPTAALLISTCLACGFPSTAAYAQEATSQGARTWVGKCVTADPLSDRAGDSSKQGFAGAILGILAPKLIGAGLDAFGKALRKAGEKDVTPLVARQAVQFPGQHGRRCIHFVSGRFYSADADGRLPAPSRAILGPIEGHIGSAGAAALSHQLNGLAATPDIYLEMRLHPSDDQSAMILAPTYLYYGNGIKAKRGAERGLAVNITFHPPGKPADDSSATGGDIVFGKMRVGEHRRFRVFDDELGFESTSPWFPTTFRLDTPAAPPVADEVDPAPNPPVTRKPVRSRAARAGARSNGGLTRTGAPDPDATTPTGGSSAPGRAAPLNMTVTVTETRDPRKFLLFLADVFDKSQTELQTELERLVIKQKREEAELTAATAANEVRDKYENAFVDAKSAWLEMCEIEGSSAASVKQRLEKWKDYSKNARIANLKASAFGWEPFADETQPSATRPESCGAV